MFINIFDLYFYHHLEGLISSHFLEKPSCKRKMIPASVLLNYFYFYSIIFLYVNNSKYACIVLFLPSLLPQKERVIFAVQHFAFSFISTS